MDGQHVAYVIFNGTNLYWSKYPEGWVDNVGQGNWYGDKCEVMQDVKQVGGIVVSVGHDGSMRA